MSKIDDPETTSDRESDFTLFTTVSLLDDLIPDFRGEDGRLNEHTFRKLNNKKSTCMLTMNQLCFLVFSEFSSSKIIIITYNSGIRDIRHSLDRVRRATVFVFNLKL